ncbi:hypothetical protein LEMLEM_LOCUS7032 [Lemmus lemmus]
MLSGSGRPDCEVQPPPPAAPAPRPPPRRRRPSSAPALARAGPQGPDRGGSEVAARRAQLGKASCSRLRASPASHSEGQVQIIEEALISITSGDATKTQLGSLGTRPSAPSKGGCCMKYLFSCIAKRQTGVVYCVMIHVPCSSQISPESVFAQGRPRDNAPFRTPSFLVRDQSMYSGDEGESWYPVRDHQSVHSGDEGESWYPVRDYQSVHSGDEGESWYPVRDHQSVHSGDEGESWYPVRDHQSVHSGDEGESWYPVRDQSVHSSDEEEF